MVRKPAVMPPRIACLALLALAGCTRDTASYPSLAPRPVEKVGFAEPDAPKPLPVVADPALDGQIGAATAALAKAKTSFATAAEKAARSAAAARGAAAGSEAWIAAQSDLADLDALRADTSGVVTTLEQLAIERAAVLQAEYPALRDATAAAHAEAAAETARIDALQGMLKR